MKGFLLRSVLGILATAAVLVSISCGRNHDLVFIEVTPQTQTLGVGCSGPLPTDCGPTTTYLAIGHYIHPTDQHDLTGQVQWSTSNPDLITFADPSRPNVLFPTGTGCGTGLQVRAILNVTSENEKVGIATVNVNCGSGGSGTGGAADFSLTSLTGTQTVAPGNTANYTIQVTALSGTPTVSLAVNTNNLPAQVSAFTLKPSSVTGTGTSILSLTGSSTAGTGTVQVLGADATGGATVNVNITVQ